MIEYEDYFNECWGNMPDSVITDEYFEKNRDLLQSITYDFYQYHTKSYSLPPNVACILLQRVFENMLSFGVR